MFVWSSMLSLFLCVSNVSVPIGIVITIDDDDDDDERVSEKEKKKRVSLALWCVVLSACQPACLSFVEGLREEKTAMTQQGTTSMSTATQARASSTIKLLPSLGCVLCLQHTYIHTYIREKQFACTAVPSISSTYVSYVIPGSSRLAD